MTRPIRVAHVTTVDSTLRFLLLPQLRRLRDEGFEVSAISAPGPWTEALEREGIRHVAWDHATRSWSPLADARAFLELLRILKRERFDLLHTHNPKPGLLGRIAARLAGIPCVVNTVHGLYATPETAVGKRLAVLGLEWLAARFSDLELYQSEEDLAWARKIGMVGRRKGILLGNGTDLARFDPSSLSRERLSALRRDLGIPEGAPVVGTIGRLVAEKGFRELVQAAEAIRAAVPEVRFLAVGGPDLQKADAIRGRELARLREVFIVTGWREEVAELIGLMDVFVLASWREGVPRSAIEAAAMGRPLVLTNIRGCREVARHDLEGLLVPPRDPGRLADAVVRLLKDPSRAHRLGVAARARAIERFDERRVAETILVSYRRLLSRKGLPGPPGEKEAPAASRPLRKAR